LFTLNHYCPNKLTLSARNLLGKKENSPFMPVTDLNCTQRHCPRNKNNKKRDGRGGNWGGDGR
ncbi:MAG: hypothetical protein U9Q71_01865, partial [Pseudomonadota bacterium]|nr:hypothetical protein [Pseudomonadota bacterium]